MGTWSDLVGTSKNMFKIAKGKFTINASAPTSPRTMTIGDHNIDFTSGNTGDFLKKVSSTSVAFASVGGGGSSYVYRSFSNNALSNTVGLDLCPPMLIIESCTLISGRIGLEDLATTNLEFDIRKNGVSILTTAETIAAGQQFSSGFSFSSTSLAANDLLTIELTTGTCNGFNAVLKIQL